MRIYISGPMTGIPNFNAGAFNRAEEDLTIRGHFCVNPASLGGGEELQWTWDDYLKRDIISMLTEKCEAIAVLDGWQKSKGAMLEVHIGRELGMMILKYPTLEPFSETVLEEAARLVGGDRNRDYGHPYDDFIQTSTMWTGMFWQLLKDPVNKPIQPEHVPLAMNCVKISREMTNPKRDNRVDGPGYWQTGDMVHQRKKQMAEGKIQ